MDNVKCNLCFKKNGSVKSHVIPKFMFKSIFDEKHKISRIDFTADHRSTTSDTGYDTKILCKECDTGLLNNYEIYACNTFFKAIEGKRAKKIILTSKEKREGFERINVSGLDYNKLKLFFLSILWRAHVTTNSFFKSVNIAAYGDQIRLMLQKGIACDDLTFKIVLVKINKNSARPFNALIPPRKIKENNNSFYVFYINSYMIFFNISLYNQAPIFKNAYLKETGELELLILSEFLATKIFDGLVGIGIEYSAPFNTKDFML
jgi:hypothetical protein